MGEKEISLFDDEIDLRLLPTTWLRTDWKSASLGARRQPALTLRSGQRRPTRG